MADLKVENAWFKPSAVDNGTDDIIKGKIIWKTDDDKYMCISNVKNKRSNLETDGVDFEDDDVDSTNMKSMSFTIKGAKISKGAKCSLVTGGKASKIVYK